MKNSKENVGWFELNPTSREEKREKKKYIENEKKHYCKTESKQCPTGKVNGIPWWMYDYSIVKGVTNVLFFF